MKSFVLTVISLMFLSAGFCVFASEIGTIQSGSQYAWGENIGWINFAPQTNSTYEGLSVSNNSITGYAWSSNLGWINFSPTNSGQGVSNTIDGHLSGSAWVTGLGWLPMDGVVIDANGKFTGIAGTEGSTVGRVSFDCSNCNVVTNWRPNSSVQPVVNPPTTHSSISKIPEKSNNPIIPPTGESYPGLKVITSNNPQIILGNISKPITNQGGLVSFTVSDGRIVNVDFPAGTFDGNVIITISEEKLTQDSAPSPGLGAYLVGGLIFDIVAKDQNGNVIHNLNKKITITIDIPKNLQNQPDLGAYYLNESNPLDLNWVLISDAIFKDGKAYISVDHLTRFGIFSNANHLKNIATGVSNSSLGVMANSKLYLWFLVFLLLLMVVALVVKKQ